MADVCALCEEAQATEVYVFPVCLACYESLTGLQEELEEMEADDPHLAGLASNVEKALLTFLGDQDG